MVLEQKAMIEQQLASLRGSGRPSAPALKNLKRGGSTAPTKTHVPPTKKQKVSGTPFCSCWQQDAMSMLPHPLTHRQNSEHLAQTAAAYTSACVSRC